MAATGSVAYETSKRIREAIRGWKKSLKPPFKWYGGKSLIAGRIAKVLPWSHVYAEPYCGSAAVLFAIEPRPVEAINDLDDRVVNVFRVLQDERKFEELAHRLTWTPYSFSEYKRAIDTENRSDVERAWALIVEANMSFAGQAHGLERDWTVSRKCNEAKGKLWSGVAGLDLLHKRLKRVVIDNRDALEFMDRWDSDETTFYVDPPYVPGTRALGETDKYRFEASEEHHKALVGRLLQIKGQAVVSGYDSPVYKPLEEAGWRKVKIEVHCNAERAQGRKRGKRTECLWIKSFSRPKRAAVVVDVGRRLL